MAKPLYHALSSDASFPEVLFEHLSHIEALLEVALSSCFHGQSELTIHNYLWAVQRQVQSAITVLLDAC